MALVQVVHKLQILLQFQFINAFKI